MDSEQDSLLKTQELPAELRQNRPPQRWRLKSTKMQEIQRSGKKRRLRGSVSDHAAGEDLIRCQCASGDSDGDEASEKTSISPCLANNGRWQIRCMNCETLVDTTSLQDRKPITDARCSSTAIATVFLRTHLKSSTCAINVSCNKPLIGCDYKAWRN